MALLEVSVVSADREVYSGQAEFVAARTTEGEIGILPGHVPMIGVLAAGEVRITLVGGEKLVANAQDGFLSVDRNVVTIVAGTAALV
ncbi:MAG: F0F1 ATP synthase subunit epsilon [Microbacteriaceae bacterium]